MPTEFVKLKLTIKKENSEFATFPCLDLVRDRDRERNRFPYRDCVTYFDCVPFDYRNPTFYHFLKSIK